MRYVCCACVRMRMRMRMRSFFWILLYVPRDRLVWSGVLHVRVVCVALCVVYKHGAGAFLRGQGEDNEGLRGGRVMLCAAIIGVCFVVSG